jgi:integrase/recombinase XerD
MSVGLDWTREGVLAAFDDHLRRTRGVGARTRVNYARFVGAFLEERFPDGRVDVGELDARGVIAFIGGTTRRYQPRTVELAATSLRSFFRFLRSLGLGREGLEDAVPMLPHRRSGLVRHLDPSTLQALLESLPSSTARELRDRAIILCVARLGLRPGEVCRLRLDDIDWREGVLVVRTRKTGHGARLPITAEVGHALAEYLQGGRPPTSAREVFVLLRLRPGTPIRSDIVGRAVDAALTRAAIDAPTRGGNLLRHSLATDLLARGVGLGEIASLLGHGSLATTRIYAAVDIDALRQVALPWPGATS